MLQVCLSLGVKTVYCLLLLSTFGGCQLAATAHEELNNAHRVRTINIVPDAWAGSSVNVMANVRQTLFTHNAYQYTGFYDQQGRLVLGKRPINQDSWHLVVSQFTGNVADAHNHISLVVDGEGYLHVAWDHHNSTLKYARATQPGSLQLSPATMIGTLENSVTYPQFYPLPNGDLLFQYRSGGSGKGNLVLNLYQLQQQNWQRVHTNLLDGQGQRSAYWDMNIDPQGVLHLAWMWRETSDVATNHDMHYAQSLDQGQSWQSISGQVYAVPMNLLNVAPVLAIKQQHNLMNPPVVAADKHSQPYIASYWSDTPESIPAYGVVTFNHHGWQTVRGPQAAQAFTLQGTGTKNPPWSRPVLLVESDGQGSGFHLIYRDNAHQAIMVSSVLNVTEPKWQHLKLKNWPKDGWEPAYDPAQWQSNKQIHMLIQHAEQRDGNDTLAAKVVAQPLDLLIWSPARELSQ